MKKIKSTILLLMLLVLPGCMSLVPKTVEFGQRKVKEFPVEPARLEEARRQAAEAAARKAEETLNAAAAEDCSPAVIEPAQDSAALSKAVSTSLGPPEARYFGSGTNLAERLERQVALLNERVEAFKEKNDEVAGKKIEGTGWLQVPYFIWIALVAGAIMLLVFVLRIVSMLAAASNPAVAVGLSGLKVGGSILSKGVSQLVAGGQNFKNWVTQEVKDADLQTKILNAFATSHQTAQDGDVQEIVKVVKEQ